MSLSSQMRDTITVASQTATSGFGAPVFAAQRTLRARVILVEAVGKGETVSDAVVYCETQLFVSDRIWLPGSSTTDPEAARKPRKVERAMELSGSRTLWKASL